MRASSVLALLCASSGAAAAAVRRQDNTTDVNPWDGKKLFANPAYAKKLEQTYNSFVSAGDTANAEKTRAIQKIGTFVWVSNIASLSNIDAAITAARAEQSSSGQKQMVGLVLYNLPDRDCSAGESAGELSSANGGLQRYKSEFVDVYAQKLAAATDLSFAVVLEPDSLANAITNTQVEFCAKAATVYEQGIGYAISKLQLEHVAIYIDAAHGGWLGWDDNLPLTAKEMAKVVALAGPNAKIRGFATNVSNYNPFNATVRENFTEYSNSWDEGHYATSLAPFLEAEGLPSKFIIDQGRVALPGSRKEWGEWCNVSPAGFGIAPGTPVEHPNVDSIVWIKPGGESDGRCGLTGAPAAGAWFDAYVQMLVKNADASITA